MVVIDNTLKFYELMKKKCDDPDKKTLISNHILFNKQPKKPNSYKKDIILEASISINNSIKTLESFLNEHKESYISTSSHIQSRSRNKITEEEKEDIEKLALNQIEVCMTSIKSLEDLVQKHYTISNNNNNNNKYFDSSITTILESIRDDPSIENNKKFTTTEALKKFGPRVVFYLNIVEQLKINLNNISNVFKKLREFRIDYKLKENERLSSKAIHNLNSNQATPTPSSTFNRKKNINGEYDYEEEENEKIKAKAIYDEDEDDMEFDEEELLIYEKQNVELKAELETLSDQIDVINRQVEELSQLFDEITPHILIHKEVIENIYSTNVDATNYISRGNNKIYEATKKSFDFRVMVLLFLIICSLGLLFLNWYQD